MKHGHRTKRYTSPTYHSWKCMRDRCCRKTAYNYARYGGRGIKVCDRWKNSFENFLEDMGGRPEGMTLDRIDNDGNYEPGNCRWATQTEQNKNQDRYRLLRCYSGPNGEKDLDDWSRISGTNRETVVTRYRRGWPDKEAVFGRRSN